MISLRVDTLPRGKGRPRFKARIRDDGRLGGRTYTDTKTLTAELEIQHAWQKAGRARIEGRDAIAVHVTALIDRPNSHRLRSGMLSAAAKRKPWPTKTPDADNVGKLVCDALNGLAYDDDALICRLTVTKRWAPLDEKPGLLIDIESFSELGSDASIVAAMRRALPVPDDRFID